MEIARSQSEALENMESIKKSRYESLEAKQVSQGNYANFNF